MKMAQALATAAEQGWQDDSQWTRSTVAEQVSRVNGRLLSAITVLTDGTIRWGVSHLDRKVQAQSGNATSPEAAIRACDERLASITGTLF
jgi:hypothetical protein